MPLLTRRSLLATLPGIANTPFVKRLDGSRLACSAIDEKIPALMRAAQIPGLAVAVLNGAELVYLRAFGLRDVERQLRLTPQTSMPGLSLTKSVFAYTVMQMAEEGLVHLDRPIDADLKQPLPEFEDYRDLQGDDRWKRFTPAMLLSHTSGLPNWRRFTLDQKLRILFEPGTQYSYSGEGIALLQFVIEQKLGKSMGPIIQERVFTPLGMNRTGMVWRPEFETDFAQGYDEAGKPLGRRKRSKPQTAGSMDSTVSDFALFAQAMLRQRGLRKKSWDRMLTPQVRIREKSQFPVPPKEKTTENDAIRLSYGLGWGVFFTPHGKAFFKEGHDDGWENHCVCFEKSRTAVLLMSNSANGDSVFKELLEYLIADRYTPWRWEGYIPYDAAGSGK